ncbi:MAG: hypothetical protein ACO3RB_08225 [Ilumatobacteraceae bacterium]
MVPQRHHRWFLLRAVRGQGGIVVGYWLFNYLQYVATPYGAFMRRQFTSERWTPRKQAFYSERYVLRMSTLAVLWFVAALVSDRGSSSGGDRLVILWVVGIVGGFRVWEVFWAQVHYALQTEKSRVTSFTRTLLFHVFFIVEAVMNATTWISFHVNEPVKEVFPVMVDVVTLQRSISDNVVLVTWMSKLVAYGVLAMSLVILLVAVPLVVGVVAKTWFQNTDAIDEEDNISAVVGLEPVVGERWTLVRGERTISETQAVKNWRFSRGAVVDATNEPWKVSTRVTVPVNTLLIFSAVLGAVACPPSWPFCIALVAVAWSLVQAVLLGAGVLH